MNYQSLCKIKLGIKKKNNTMPHVMMMTLVWPLPISMYWSWVKVIRCGHSKNVIYKIGTNRT